MATTKTHEHRTFLDPPRFHVSVDTAAGTSRIVERGIASKDEAKALVDRMRAELADDPDGFARRHGYDPGQWTIAGVSWTETLPTGYVFEVQVPATEPDDANHVVSQHRTLTEAESAAASLDRDAYPSIVLMRRLMSNGPAIEIPWGADMSYPNQWDSPA